MNDRNSFTISKFINAKREKVYEAWTNPGLQSIWGCPEHCQQGPMQVDFCVGGKYRNTMFEDNEEVTVFGTYLEIIPNLKLAFTSQWEGGTNPETIVTIEFKDKDGGTELTLTQTGFYSESAAKGHQEGWASTLDKLAEFAPDLSEM